MHKQEKQCDPIQEDDYAQICEDARREMGVIVYVVAAVFIAIGVAVWLALR